MKRKQAPKLTLQTATLRMLTFTELSQAAGGAQTGHWSCAFSCLFCGPF